MSTEGPDRQQQRVAEFMKLLPLTLALAGLPQAETGRHYNDDQLGVRADTLRRAYKAARQLVLEIAK